MEIPIDKAVTALNDAAAAELRKAWRSRRLFCLNLIAAPGAGKTALIERTVERLGSALRILVVEGDPHTGLDSERVRAQGVESVQINTLGGCHLDAKMIQRALGTADLDGVDLLIIENVGNLLCPAAWDLGEDIRVVVASLPEGADKPLKYPETFTLAHALVINKIDLEPHLPAKTADIRKNALNVNPDLVVFEISCLVGTGIKRWCAWLEEKCRERKRQ